MTREEFIAAGLVKKMPTIHLRPSVGAKDIWTPAEAETMRQHKPRNRGWRHALNQTQRKAMGLT